MVAEELHFGRAAERLSMTQPPLSRRIQALEHELGVELFTRRNRSISLTSAGMVFLVDARRLLGMSAEAAINARRAPAGDAGSISIGFTPSIAYSYLGELLQVVRTLLPNVEVLVRELLARPEMEALLEGSIDIALLRPSTHVRGLRYVRVHSEPMMAAVAESDAAAGRESLHAEEFDHRPVIMYWPAEPWASTPPIGHWNELLTRAFAKAGIEPQCRQYVTNVHAALALVQAGLGWALVPQCAEVLRFAGVALVPVDGFGRLRADIELSWNPDRPNPARDALIAALTPSPGRRRRSVRR